VQGHHVGARVAPQDWKVKKITVEMENIEAVSVVENQFHEPDVMRERLATLWIAPKRLWATWHEPSPGLRVAARIERHLVPLADQLFGQVRNNPLRTTVKERRNAFIERSNLRDAHENNSGGRQSIATRADLLAFYVVKCDLAIRLPRPRNEWLFCIESTGECRSAPSCRDRPLAGLPSKV
jgi:hypothetical protein